MILYQHIVICYGGSYIPRIPFRVIPDVLPLFVTLSFGLFSLLLCFMFKLEIIMFHEKRVYIQFIDTRFMVLSVTE